MKIEEQFHSTPSRKMPYSCLATIYRHMIRNSPLKKRERSEPKCVPQLFLESLLGSRRSAIGPFFLTNFKEQTQESPSYLACSFPSIFSPFFPFFVSFVFCLYVFNQYLAFSVIFVRESPRCISPIVSLGFLAIFLRISVICYSVIIRWRYQQKIYS